MKYLNRILLMLMLSTGIHFCLFSPVSGHAVNKKEKKIELEFSVGAANINPESIYQRTSGTDFLIRQYAEYYQLGYSAAGTLNENKLLIPFNFSLNYYLKEKWYLKAGIDYGSNSVSSEKSYQVAWADFNETHEYNITNKISYLVPHVGMGLRFSSFDLYGAVGLGFARFKHIEDLNYSEPGFGYDTTYTFQVKGTAPAVIIGIKYRIKLGKKTGKGINAIVKLESLLLKVNRWNGSKTTVGSESVGESYSETKEGTLYMFEWNPYGDQWFDYWDLLENIPSGADPLMRNTKELGIQLSGFRLMIGIAF